MIEPLLTPEYLLRQILAWYANPKHWANPGIELLSKSPVAIDSGRLARMALEAKSAGSLLPLVCDCFNIPLTVLIQKSKMDPSRGLFIANGAEMTIDESHILYRSLNDLMRKS